MEWMELSNYQRALLALSCLFVGYFIFRAMLFMLPRRLRLDNQQQKEELLQKAKRQKDHILADAKQRLDQKLQLQKEELDQEMEHRLNELKHSEDELKGLNSTLSKVESRIAKQENDFKAREQKVAAKKPRILALEESIKANKQKLVEALAQHTGTDANQMKQRLTEQMITDRQLASQKALKDLGEELTNHSSRFADRMLRRVCARYAPEFVWPKSSYFVEVSSHRIFEALAHPENRLLADLREASEGVQIELSTDKDDSPLGVKLVGGYGIYKEAARQTLEEVLKKSPASWGKAASLYQSHCAKLNQEALRLGQKAVIELHLEGLHDEILRMIGALNWRTSYRQNQYLHSIEVATFAGILAHELGVDPELAKRSGLLHDIGKGIDYRIEGSHAVISGDYADRYGESRVVCDTVMSHHNDLVLETPLSYVLKTADTLSGARPGARVNLEEGYQIRLSSIDQAVRSFHGVSKVAIMSGGREVHVEVHHNKVKAKDLESLAKDIAKRIEEEVAFPGQIRVLVSRRFESVAVA